jgi:secondary thiamine-phosphate synthase enzyme
MVYQDTIQLSTTTHGHMHRLDGAMQNVVDESGVTTGLVNVFNVGSTGAICMIEFEPGLEKDLPEMLNRLIPPSRTYGHEQMWHDGNGHSHLQASLVGPSMTIPVRDGTLALGTWQQIIHLECDNKPRRRELIITVYGE